MSQQTSAVGLKTKEQDEDWTKVSDLVERRRIQNRIAQRNYRKRRKMKLSSTSSHRDQEFAREPASSSQAPTAGDPQAPSLTAADGIVRIPGYETGQLAAAQTTYYWGTEGSQDSFSDITPYNIHPAAAAALPVHEHYWAPEQQEGEIPEFVAENSGEGQGNNDSQRQWSRGMTYQFFE